jgi:hypothetical protein
MLVEQNFNVTNKIIIKILNKIHLIDVYFNSQYYIYKKLLGILHSHRNDLSASTSVHMYQHGCLWEHTPAKFDIVTLMKLCQDNNI